MGFKHLESEISGSPNSKMEGRRPGRPYRKLEPSNLRQRYVHIPSKSKIVINRTRGFGQYALNKFPNKSIGVFIHRGDSQGESGSGAYFLGNVELKHEPLSRLFDKLSEKLADTALIVTDGSLTKINFLKSFFPY